MDVQRDAYRLRCKVNKRKNFGDDVILNVCWIADGKFSFLVKIIVLTTRNVYFKSNCSKLKVWENILCNYYFVIISFLNNLSQFPVFESVNFNGTPSIIFFYSLKFSMRKILFIHKHKYMRERKNSKLYTHSMNLNKSNTSQLNFHRL